MWTFDQLKQQLTQRKNVKSFILTQENVHRRERYFLLDGETLIADQDRDVNSQSIEAKIFVDLPRPGRQGEISKKLFKTMPLAPQLDSAVEAALQTDHQAWELPTEIATELPQLRTSDPRMAEDLESVVKEATDRIKKAVSKKRTTVFNSAELFLSVHDRELHLSNGLVHRSAQSRIYVESAYSFSKRDAAGNPRSDEYLNTQWAVSLADLPLEKLFDDTSDRAENSLVDQKPETGKYSVIIDADVLTTLLTGYVAQLTSAHAYHGLPFIKPEEEWIKHAQGDLITLTLDPFLEFGADTTALSEQGMKQSPLKLVENNRVVATATSKQYADYLGTKANTVRGNVVVDAGTSSFHDLTQQAPKVIEILQFSGLFADSNSGTFSSEIRLARLYDNEKKTITYLKGGSLSGNIQENFKGIRLSKNRVKRSYFSANQQQGQGYFGPEFALLSEVSIVG